jgi:hypothetical protein
MPLSRAYAARAECNSHANRLHDTFNPLTHFRLQSSYMRNIRRDGSSISSGTGHSSPRVWFLVRISAVIAAASAGTLVAISRVILGYHTQSQVWWGGAVGAIFGLSWTRIVLSGPVGRIADAILESLGLSSLILPSNTYSQEGQESLQNVFAIQAMIGGPSSIREKAL